MYVNTLACTRTLTRYLRYYCMVKIISAVAFVCVRRHQLNTVRILIQKHEHTHIHAYIHPTQVKKTTANVEWQLYQYRVSEEDNAEILT
jgi:hypothetical protein